MRDRGVDGVFGDVALDAEIVVVLAFVLRQRAALLLHLVGGLPGANDHFAEPAHGLRIRRHHRERAEIVQDVFGRNGLFTDPAFGKGEIFRDRRVEMVTHHQHVEMFVDGVAGERPRRIGRGRQHVLQARNFNDVRRMTAAGAFGMEGVNGTALERLHGIFDETGFVQRIRMQHHLDVVIVGNAPDNCRWPPASCPNPRAASARRRRP